MIIGLTGTPWLLDGRGLSAVFDVMETSPAPSWRIEQGFLLPCRVIGSTRKLVAISQGIGGDYDLAKAEEILSKKEITGDAVATCLNLFLVILGCLDGRFIGIEVKTASGRQREAQDKFQAAFERAGGIYTLARSVDAAQAAEKRALNAASPIRTSGWPAP